jgi:hypothetical protein
MVSYELDKADVAAFRKQMKRMETELGKSVEASIKWAAITLMKSLAARTLVSKKLRPVVENPHPNAKTDGRRGKWGVMRYKRFGNGEQYFQPIYRTGEYGKTRFVDKKTFEWYTIDKATGKRVKESITSQEGGDVPLSIGKSKKRIIGRSGFSKRIWKWAQAHMYNSGNSGIMGVPNIIGVTVIGKGNDRSLTIHNRSRYAVDALKGGSSAVSESMRAAAQSLEYKINEQLKKRLAK